MANNENLFNAKKAKNDEFYTQYEDIQAEMNAYIEYNPNVFRDKVILCPCDDPEWSNFTKFFAQNFQKFGIKKLISTSFAADSKPSDIVYEPTAFETSGLLFDEKKTRSNGKIFILDKDNNNDGKINIDDLDWHYLEGDGDFRSDEITKLRDESDIIITNGPFSLFREFLAWIIAGNKLFSIIGNVNSLTYKDVFHLLKNNKIWIGATNFNKGMYFRVPNNFVYDKSYKFDKERNGVKVNRVSSVCWFTNLDHGRRHKPLSLMSMQDNIRFSKCIKVKDIGYYPYENYEGIDVPEVDAIPSDYKGIMGVPITFMDKYCPEQFDILALGIVGSCDFTKNIRMEILDKCGNPTGKYTKNAKGTLYRKHYETDTKPAAFKDCETGELYQSIYARVLIKAKGV